MKENIDLSDILEEVSKFEDEFIQSSARIMNAGDNKLFALDFLALSVNNRAVSLIQGFLVLAEKDNFLTAASLLRMQLDNALRFFASTLVESSSDFAEHFIDGKAIRDYKDISGNKLTDAYLTKKLEEYFPGVKNLYRQACSYIHLSEKHFFSTLRKKNEENDKIEIVIGGSGNIKEIDKIEFSIIMRELCKLVLIVVEQWKHEKIKLSKLYDK